MNERIEYLKALINELGESELHNLIEILKTGLDTETILETANEELEDRIAIEELEREMRYNEHKIYDLKFRIKSGEEGLEHYLAEAERKYTEAKNELNNQN